MTPEQARRMLSIAKALDKQAARADEMSLTDSSGGEIGSMLGSYAEILRSQVEILLSPMRVE